ncbi:collagen-binding domain-containing protein, partial [Clostridium vitabionis]|uniref:collagen-binding domain-containing protein n=1 Tax=Clostridium vitabionis TaxID=2784388 RepID=UPI001A9B4C3D
MNKHFARRMKKGFVALLLATLLVSSDGISWILGCSLPDGLAIRSFGDAYENGEIATPASLSELENREGQSWQAKSSEYRYEDNEVSIWVTAEKNALPDDAKFVVTPVTKNSKDFNYDAYLTAYQESFGDGTDIDDAANTDEDKAFFYDMRFLTKEIGADGKPTGKEIEVEPAEGTVTVTVTLAKKAEKQEGVELEDDIHPGNSSAQAAEALSVTHLPLKSEVKSKNGGMTAGAEITAQDILVQPMEDKIISQTETSVQFKADEFSVYALRVMPAENNASQATSGSSSKMLTPQSVLGTAMNYGIVANKFYLLGGRDAETNVAAKVGTCGTQTGNTEKTNGQAQTFMIGCVENTFLIKGKKNTIIKCPKDQKDNFQAKESVEFTFQYEDQNTINGMIDQMITSASEQISTDNVQYEKLEYGPYDQKYHLDLRSKPAGTYYVNLIIENPAPYQVQPMGEDEKLIISKNDDQAVVLVDSSETVTLHKFKVMDKGSDSLTDKDGYSVAKGIFFCLPNSTTVNIDGGIVGTVLAPKATVNVNRTSAGHLVANIVNIMDGEWHNIDQEKPNAPEEKPTPGAPTDATPGAPTDATPGAPTDATPGAPTDATPGAPT